MTLYFVVLFLLGQVNAFAVPVRLLLRVWAYLNIFFILRGAYESAQGKLCAMRSPFVFCHNKRDPNDPAHRDHWRWPDGAGGGGCFGRWFALENFPVRAELVAVCDLREELLEWFAQVPTVQLRTQDHRALLAGMMWMRSVAVPHHLHEALYCDVLAAGEDLLAEKPFGIDLAAARRIREAAEASGRFVRCSSEFPFAGAQRAFQYVNPARWAVCSVRAGFLHSSDLDTRPPTGNASPTPAARLV